MFILPIIITVVGAFLFIKVGGNYRTGDVRADKGRHTVRQVNVYVGFKA